MNNKIILIPIIIILIASALIMAQPTGTTKPIVPKTTNMIRVCYQYTLTDAKTAESSIKKTCKDYPKDLTSKCSYTRYNVPFNCKDILEDTINKDIKNWYTEHLPSEITKEVDLSDIKITSSNDVSTQDLVGCDYDLESETIKCKK